MHIVAGTKEGKLLVIELASGDVHEVEGAHNGTIWKVCVYPNGKGLASGSSDKTVKFWDFKLGANKTLQLVEKAVLEVFILSSL